MQKIIEINEDFFEYTYKILHVMGMGPYHGKNICYKALSFINLSTVLFLLILEFIYIFTAPDGFVEAVKTIGTTAYHVTCTSRLIHFIIFSKTYEELVEAIERKSFSFENFDFESLKFSVENNQMKYAIEVGYSDLKKYWRPKFSYNILNEHKIRNRTAIIHGEMRKAKLLSFLLMFTILSGALGSLTFSYFKVIFLSPKIIYNEKLNTKAIVNDIPYNSYHIFDLGNALQYRLAAIYQAYAICFLTVSFIRKLKEFDYIFINTFYSILFPFNIISN